MCLLHTTDETDYESGTGYLKFEAGSSSGAVVCTIVTVVDDEVKEEKESFLFVISPGGDGAIVLEEASTDVYILDDDGMYCSTLTYTLTLNLRFIL